MAGYWDATIKRFYPQAKFIKEDWGNKTVEFDISSEKFFFDFTPDSYKDLKEAFGTVDLTLVVEGDFRYYDERRVYCTAKFLFQNVKFPG